MQHIFAVSPNHSASIPPPKNKDRSVFIQNTPIFAFFFSKKQLKANKKGTFLSLSASATYWLPNFFRKNKK
jgi:hypothetical protein